VVVAPMAHPTMTLTQRFAPQCCSLSLSLSVCACVSVCVCQAECRLWPRGSAVAERLWTGVADTEHAARVATAAKWHARRQWLRGVKLLPMAGDYPMDRVTTPTHPVTCSHAVLIRALLRR
jgi:hypothetical protein